MMSNSTVVVAATIVSEPDAIMKELGVVEYSFDIQISELLHGVKPKQGKIRVSMTRFEAGKDDAIPFLKENTRCIFFLTAGKHYSVADMWFGIQSFNSEMANRIKELSSGQIEE